MNEFIEQFLIEARELVDQAVADLLALEATPGDRERLDSAFRAFHTLKGSAGIIEFAAMGRALSGAEDVLSRVRTGQETVTPALISDALTCLDQVAQWLEAIEMSGEPPPGAEPAADAIVARFSAAPAPPPLATKSWRDALLAAHPEVRGTALTAIRYAPDSETFMRAEDPVAMLQQTPGFLTLDMEAIDPGAALEDIDPFQCRLVLTVLASAPAAAVATALSNLGAQVDIEPLAPTAGDGLPEIALELLQAQILMLANTEADGLSGRVTAAAAAAMNVLRHIERLSDAERIGDALHASLAAQVDPQPLIATLEDLLSITKDDHAPAPEAAATIQPETTARSLRVDVERIDALVRLTGELIVVKNSLGHAAGLAQAGDDPKRLAERLKDQHALLDRLVAELQRAVFGIRVLPMSHVFQRFPRLIREIGISLQKPVRLVTEGENVEADKSIVEGLFEPLLHVVRNAVDHGIESAERRTALSKPGAATIRLRAAREGEHVIVEVSDDGRGIDTARVRQIAGARGLHSPEALSAMSDAEAIKLIFAPGFSTSTTVSDLSGRGVGMDAVRVAVERLGGQVQLETQIGVGTTVRFVLPLTLIMSRVMTVEAGGQLFGIPLDVVVETVRLPRKRIAAIGAGQAFVLRERSLPLCDLADSLGIQSPGPEAAEATIVVASVAGQVCGLQVERVVEQLDVMLKPMEGLLSGMVGVLGTTLLGDGQVLIILDLGALLG